MGAAAVPAYIAVEGYRTITEYQAEQEQADYQNRMSRQNAQFAELQAKQALKIGEEKAQRYTEQVNQLIGSQKLAYASSGVDIGFGTAQKVMSETRNLGLQDAMDIRTNSILEAMGYQFEASQWKQKGEMAKRTAAISGPQTLLAGGLRTAKNIGYYNSSKDSTQSDLSTL